MRSILFSLETTKELEELSQEVRGTASPERLQANAQTISDLVASGLSASALREGGAEPHFSLPDARGHVVALETLLDRGPVVISFTVEAGVPSAISNYVAFSVFSPDCAVGASLVAISPQLPDHSLSTEEKNQLTFPVLSDVGNIVAKRFGIVFTLPTALVDANRAIGRDLVEINGEAGQRNYQCRRHLFQTKAASFVLPLSKKTGANGWIQTLS